MTNNDILRSFRYALDLSDAQVVTLFDKIGFKFDLEVVKGLFRKEDQPGYTSCDDDMLLAFFDGLILDRRGPRKPGSPLPPPETLSNNLILRKIRIALELREKDMLTTLKLGGMQISRGELSALFRKPGHRHYRECGDQLLRNFMKGLAATHRRKNTS